MPPKIRTLASQLLTSPEEIRLSVSKPAAGIDQQIYLAKDHQKLPLLEHLMGTMDVKSMVLFTSRKSEVNAIVRALAKRGYVAKGISSDLEQEEREIVLREFKNKQLQIIVATDVLSRGIDVDSISHVVNYDVPRDAEDYVHRIGRTARAATTGTAITFVNEADLNKLGRIEKLIERKLDRLSITEELGYGPGPVAGVKDEPGPFDRGRSNGRGGRDNSRNGRNNGRGGDGTRQGRPERAVGERSPRHESASAAITPTVDGEVTTAELPEATAVQRIERDPNQRNNRRRNRGPRPEGEQITPATAEGNEVIKDDVQAVAGEASKPRRKKRRKSRPKESPTEGVITDGVPATVLSADASVAKPAPEPAVSFAPISTWREID